MAPRPPELPAFSGFRKREARSFAEIGPARPLQCVTGMKNLIEQLKSLAANARKQAEGYVAQARSYALDKWKALQKRLVEQG